MKYVKELSFGNGYSVRASMDIRGVEHFCSGLYCYNLGWNVQEDGVMLDSLDEGEIITPERLKHLVAYLVAGMLQDAADEEVDDDWATSIRSAFYIANRPIGYNEESGAYRCVHGISQYDIWEAMEGTRSHMIHSQSYDDGSEVHIFSLEFEAEVERDDWDDIVQVHLWVPKDDIEYFSIRDSIKEDISSLIEKEQKEGEDLEDIINGILEEV